jgi:hypothetical protein
MMMSRMKLRSHGRTGYAEHMGQMYKTLKKCAILKKQAQIKISIKMDSKKCTRFMCLKLKSSRELGNEPLDSKRVSERLH